MMNNKSGTIAKLSVCALLASAGYGFVPEVTGRKTTRCEALSFNNAEDVLKKSTLPGNFGFDPLRCAQTPEQLIHYRKAEMKHARLAILAVMSILWSDLHVVDTLGATPLLEGRAFPEFLGACVGLPAALELYAEQVEEQHANDSSYWPGRLDLDLFHLYPATTKEQQRVQFGEIMSGRVCMLAAAGRLTENLLVEMGILGEEDSLVSLLAPLQTTMETVEEVAV